MAKFKQVAIVNLVEDYGKKDYAFALYKEEWELITSKDYMHNPVYVVVNARNRNNKILGVVKKLKSTEEYGKNVTAQVVGVVNMDAYNARIKEENRQKRNCKAESKYRKRTKV